jgi:DinB family protein
MHPRTRELLDYLAQQRAVLRAAFDAVPPALRDYAPAPGKWSAAACVEHLAITGQLVAARLAKNVGDARSAGLGQETSTDPILPQVNVAMVLNRDTKLNAPDPIQPTGLSADAAWAAIERADAALRDEVKASDGLALGGVSWPHPRFGPLTAYQWIAFHGAHEARHAAQIREIAETLAAAG